MVTRILFFCLVPVGVYLLVEAIKVMRKSFGGQVLLEISYAQQSGTMSLPQAGDYAIWVKGPVFRKTPLDQFVPQIYEEKTRRPVTLYRPTTRMTSNNGSTGQQRLFTFTAPAGKYTLELTPGSSLNLLNNAVAKLIPGKDPDLSRFFILVKESRPSTYIVLGVLLILIAAACMVAGLVIGINGL